MREYGVRRSINLTDHYCRFNLRNRLVRQAGIGSLEMADAVDDKVQHHLLQFHPITFDERQVVCQTRLDGDAV